MDVQIIKAVVTRCGHHEVAPSISDHAFDIAFVIPPRWPPELVIKQIMRLQFRKAPCADTRSISKDTGHSDLGVVVENGLGNAAKESKGRDMAITERFGRLIWISELDTKVLSIFQIVPELDFKSLCTVLDAPSTEVSLSIQRMIDLHVVRISEDRISISPVLRIATQRDSRLKLTDTERTTILMSLSDVLSERMEDESGPITLIDSTILVALEGGKPASKLMEAFILPSHSVWLAKKHYDDKRWHAAIEPAKKAIDGSLLSPN